MRAPVAAPPPPPAPPQSWQWQVELAKLLAELTALAKVARETAQRDLDRHR